MSRPYRRWSGVGWYFLCGFVLHLLWEYCQLPLFARIPSWPPGFWLLVRAVATGDLLMMAVLYLLLALIHRDVFWIPQRGLMRRPITWVLPAVVGALMGICWELWAVYVAHRWSYGSMPLIPVLQVGWTPVLQMIVVPIVTILLAGWCAHKKEG